MSRNRRALVLCAAVLLYPAAASAAERLCDPQYEDCRAILLNYIRNEPVGGEIDVAYWFMTDARYSNELIARHKAGVRIRILVDPRSDDTKNPANKEIREALRSAGIPMRMKNGGGILHWKLMLFDRQNVVQFSKANHQPYAFVGEPLNGNWFDEAIYFSDDPALTNTFRRKFDDSWIDTSRFANYGNITAPLTRAYPLYTPDPSMNFPPFQDFGSRAVSRYNQEMQGLDIMVFRVSDERHTNAIIDAHNRGVRVRMIAEPSQYRDPARLWHSYNVDRLYMAGIPIKHRTHTGELHEAVVILHGLGEVIFGSSNWTESSAKSQYEHNYFYDPSQGKPQFYQWFANQFDQKWTATNNFAPFIPLPPAAPVYQTPFNGAAGQATSVTLRWEGGTWAHKYDIYFGTNADPPLLQSDVTTGSPVPGTSESFTVTGLAPGATYFWRIVGKTVADRTKTGPTWSFSTGAGTGVPAPFGGTAAPVPGTIQAENFDEGGQGVAYIDTTTGNAGGAYRATDVDIGPASDTGGGHYVGWAAAGEWLTYTVNVGTTGTYTFAARVASKYSGGTFRVEVDGSDRTGPITVPSTGAWQQWQTVSKSGVSLTAGTRVVRIVFLTNGSSGSVGNFNHFGFTASGTGTASSSTYGGTAPSLPGTIQAERFDNGGEGVAYHDTTAGNAGGAFRATDVDIGAASDTGGGYYVGWTKAGEWLKYTVSVASTGTYTVEARVASKGAGVSFRVEVDGVDQTGNIAIPDTLGWQSWRTVTKSGVPLTAGTRVIRVVFLTNGSSGSAANLNYLVFR
jgi:Tfp pilus assembly protein PilX